MRLLSRLFGNAATLFHRIAAPHYFMKVEIHYAARKDGEIKTETFARRRRRHPCSSALPVFQPITHHHRIAAPHCFMKVEIHHAARKDGKMVTEIF